VAHHEGSWEYDGTVGKLTGPGFEATVTLRCADLAHELGSCLDGADAAVSSAFLDLAGRAWVDELSTRVVAARCLLLVALTVDGRVDLWPADLEDSLVLALFRRHQARDKGLGLALGSDAVDHLARRLETLGFGVAQARSDWELGAEDMDMQRLVIVGIAAAAEAISPGAATTWKKRRLELLQTATARMRIGHRDLYAGPRVHGD
jgi:hypothetical protein